MVSNFFTDLIVGAIVLGLLVFVHELGHFIAAKYFKVRVLTFSFGFGTRLFGIKRGVFSWGNLQDEDPGHTDYRLSLLPFGGYVKMAGEDPSQPRGTATPFAFSRVATPEDDPSQPCGGDPAEFQSKPRWQRFVIALAGPVVNLALAVALLAGLYRYHYEKPAYQEQAAKVGYVAPGSPAAKAGIKPGDVIAKLGNTANPTWDDIEVRIPISPNEVLPVEVLRDNQRLDLSLEPKAQGEEQIGYAGWAPCIPASVGEVESGSPAGEAGMEVGDEILAIDGGKVPCWQSLTPALQANGGKPVEITVRRGESNLSLRVVPIYGDVGDGKKWHIGVLVHEAIVVRQLPWPQALSQAVDFNVRNSLLTADVIGKIVTRRMSAKSLSSPIGIAQLSGEAYRAGISDLLVFVSFISLQLGLFNLLPIPILDGGMILMLAIEGVLRRDVSLAIKERVLQVGLAALLMLAVYVIYNDLVRTFRPY